MKRFIGSVAWANLALLIADILNKWGSVFPGLELPPWVNYLQAILGMLSPSLAGFGHRLVYDEAQTPADRTAPELAAAAGEVRSSMIAATPTGSTIAVPTVGSAMAQGVKG